MDRNCPSELQRGDSPRWWRLLWTSSETPAGRRAERPWSPWQQQTLTPPSAPLSENLSLAPHATSVMWNLSEGGTHTLPISLSAAHTHLIPPSLPPSSPTSEILLPKLLRDVDMLLILCGLKSLLKFDSIKHQPVRSSAINLVWLNLLWQDKSSSEPGNKFTENLWGIAGYRALLIIPLWNICHRTIKYDRTPVPTQGQLCQNPS